MLRTTNVIERLNGEFRRRVKTEASRPTDDAGLVILLRRDTTPAEQVASLVIGMALPSATTT